MPSQKKSAKNGKGFTLNPISIKNWISKNRKMIAALLMFLSVQSTGVILSGGSLIGTQIFSIILMCVVLALGFTVLVEKAPPKPKYSMDFTIEYGLLKTYLREKDTDLIVETFALRLTPDVKRIIMGSDYRGTNTSSSDDFCVIFLGLEGKKLTRELIDKKYKELALKYHPDLVTGSAELMVLLNRAKEEALRKV